MSISEFIRTVPRYLAIAGACLCCSGGDGAAARSHDGRAIERWERRQIERRAIERDERRRERDAAGRARPLPPRGGGSMSVPNR